MGIWVNGKAGGFWGGGRLLRGVLCGLFWCVSRCRGVVSLMEAMVCSGNCLICGRLSLAERAGRTPFRAAFAAC